jgi:hypothetical protein
MFHGGGGDPQYNVYVNIISNLNVLFLGKQPLSTMQDAAVALRILEVGQYAVDFF